MTVLVWLSGAAIAFTIWMYRYQPTRGNDLGSVSTRWLHEHRSVTHQHR